MRKLIKILTSRLFWVAILIVIEFFLMVYLVFWAAYDQGYYTYFYLLSIAVTMFVLTRKENAAYKVVWIALSSVFPILGGVLYLIFGNKKIGHHAEKRLKEYINGHLALEKDEKEMEEAQNLLTSDDDKRLASYIYNKTGLPAYNDTEATYFPTGEEFFPDVFSELKKARKYIFMEYFIIGLGEVWDRTLEILKEKVKEGVDVRIVYDDLGSINAVPIHYDRTLARLYGIKARAFNPVKMHMNPRLNFRDHRKILSIDGEVCYTGGLNFADEYANRTIRFGYWKDNAIKIKGSACFSLTRLFLETWYTLTKELEDLELYRPRKKAQSDGIVQIFGTSPFFTDPMGENAYIQIINSAKRYVWITTPYLIPDDKLIDALRMAAGSGIDVRIITPNYPDKPQVHEVTRSNYEYLIDSGVKIYEFTPGFVHSKMFLSDDERAIVGTTNLDYRSFYLHFELSVAFFNSSIISDVKKDFEKIFDLSKQIEKGESARINPVRKLFRYFYKLFSPAL